MKKGGLGRGIDALFDGFDTKKVLDEKITELRVSEIEPNRNQPRKEFNKQALLELSESIATHGVMQPIVVRPYEDTFQIIAGERRWRAGRMAGLEKIPVVVVELDDKQAAEVALVENLQREDLNPIEEALGYQNLIDNYGLTQEDVARRVGKSRSSVSNSLRLLALPEEAVNKLESKEMSAGHGKALLGLMNDKTFTKALEMALDGASVRELEELEKKPRVTKKPKEDQAFNKFVQEAQVVLSGKWGKGVKIKSNAGKSGSIEIKFKNKAHLEEILGQLVDDVF